MAAARYKMISIPEAQSIVLQRTPVLEKETVPLHSGVDRILAETVTAKDNLPPFPASIMVGLSCDVYCPCDATLPVLYDIAKCFIDTQLRLAAEDKPVGLLCKTLCIL